MAPTSAEVAVAAEQPKTEKRLAERLRVNEIFYSIQGESTRAGQPCVFVRLTGCQMRCRWCDTVYSFYEGNFHGCPLVELTGGEPLLQPAAIPFLARLCDAGYEVMLETGGGIDISPVDPRVRRIVDIKCPGSGEAANNLWSNLDVLRPTDELKLVLAGEEDYLWARDLVTSRRLFEICPVHFSPVHGEIVLADLAAWILRDRLPVRLQVQLHKLIWDPQTRGV
jgi:7-carboxy-7-deazaguanine synthase